MELDYTDVNRWKRRATFFYMFSALLTVMALYTGNYMILVANFFALPAALVCRSTADARLNDAKLDALKKMRDQ